MGRLRQEDGLGLVEILIAMLLLTLGVMAIVASYTSGTRTTVRASKTSQAASLADAQMEVLRARRYDDVWCPGKLESDDTGAPAMAVVCTDVRNVTSADGSEYEVETGVGYDCAIGSLQGFVMGQLMLPPLPPPSCNGTPAARPTKLVTIVVRRNGRVLHRQTTTFDRALGE